MPTNRKKTPGSFPFRCLAWVMIRKPSWNFRSGTKIPGRFPDNDPRQAPERERARGFLAVCRHVFDRRERRRPLPAPGRFLPVGDSAGIAVPAVEPVLAEWSSRLAV